MLTHSSLTKNLHGIKKCPTIVLTKKRRGNLIMYTMLPCSRQELGALGKATYEVLFLAFDILKYTFTYPWRDSHFAVTRAVTEPDEHLERWIKVQQTEYAFIGLVVRASSHKTSILSRNIKLIHLPFYSGLGDICHGGTDAADSSTPSVAVDCLRSALYLSFTISHGCDYSAPQHNLPKLRFFS